MFTFREKTYQYFDHYYNNTRSNERTVELPLVKEFLQKFPDCIEIGAVSPYYFNGDHAIFDLTDTHPRSQRRNAEDIDVTGKNLLSVSTIEHFSRPDIFCSKNDPEVACQILDRWLNTANKYLITWPLGYHAALDDHALSKSDAKFISRRPLHSHEWKQVTLEELSAHDKIYGTFSCANTIIVFVND